jgi:hypothetical protein
MVKGMVKGKRVQNIFVSPLIKMIIYEVEKNQTIFFISCSRALLGIDFVEKFVFIFFIVLFSKFEICAIYLHIELLKETFRRKPSNSCI